MFDPDGLHRTIACEFRHARWLHCISYDIQIPDKSLDEPEPASSQFPQRSAAQTDLENTTNSVASPLETPFESDDEDCGERRPILGTKQ